jgi:hypothetical protein
VRIHVAVPEGTPVDQPFNVNGSAAQAYRITDRVRR